MNSFKTSIRNIKRNKFSTLINMVSLVAGFICVIFIGLWIKAELSYDNFHENADRTYRIAYTGHIFGKDMKDATTSKAFYEALLTEFPEVESATILSNFHEAQVKRSNNISLNLKMSGVNPDFFNVFSLPVISGDINELANPNTAFITKSAAKKLFGNDSPVGEVISTGMDRGKKKFTIAGVVNDYPENSHLEFEILYSNTSQSWYKPNNKNWFNANFHNYVVLKNGTDYKEFEAKFNRYVVEQMDALLKMAMGISIEEFHSQGNNVFFEFHPLQKIHLTPAFDGEYKASGNMVYVYIFALAGGLILLITILNFSSLSTISSFKRKKEIGIKKVSGSSQKALVFQFLAECTLLSISGLIIAIAIVSLISPFFENIAGIGINIKTLFTTKVLLSLVGVSLLTGLLSGLYPAIYLSSLVPARVLSGSDKDKYKGLFFKDYLIISQFTISIFVITGTLFVSKQLDFLQNKNLGFNKENIIVLNSTENLSHDTNITLNKEIQNVPGVITSSSSNYIPNSDFGYYIFYHGESDHELVMDVLPCDHSFDDVYKLELSYGEFYNEGFNPELRNLVINETAAKKLYGENSVGKIIEREQQKYLITGIVKDFHYNSKQKEIPALAMVQIPDHQEFWPPLYCSVLIPGSNTAATIKEIEKVWTKIAGDTKFNYTFFDNEYNNLYKQEAQTRKVFTLFSIIAIVLSCFGLFGFIRFMIQARTKEIGIRKVNGAKRNTVFSLLISYFMKPVAIAVIISIPVTYLLVNNWLSNFAYRIDISPSYFALGILLVLASILITIARQSWLASNRNPVDALRYE